MQFEREDYSVKLLNQPETPIVKYSLLDPYFRFEIVATIEGVRLNGFTPTLSSQDEIDEFFKVIEWGHRHHVSIRETGSPISQDILNVEIRE